MELSKRLQAVADLVTEGASVADIGTDHGYIPIYLIEHHIAEKVIALDINRGPLERARMHIVGHGLKEKIETRLSDGLEKVLPGEVDTMIAAGMGGGLVIKILMEGRTVADALDTMILQPQSEIPHFRTFLMDEGYLLLDENIIYEEGKYYFMMKVRWLGAMMDDAVRQKVGDSWKTEGLDPGLAEKFGPLLLSRRDRILREYLEWMLTERRQIVGRMEQKADADNPRTICRRQEIADEITLITRALDWYDNGKEPDCV